LLGQGVVYFVGQTPGFFGVGFGSNVVVGSEGVVAVVIVSGMVTASGVVVTSVIIVVEISVVVAAAVVDGIVSAKMFEAIEGT